ncbi:F-box protein At1g78280-like isoform X2 [Macadamia integrifolia]|uniref:F-box protein At1g78280-like isoform X2 n=1 Tax=Macadamia integrifolia TaxID=60698 RepID=UPI001C4EC871|nr:F-box protein At1g78280-like isoform X2 [Macadamia integrifolia]
MEGIQSQVMEVQDRRSVALGDLRVLPDEIICDILENLTPCDVARVACVSSVMYILCNEEPLWMAICLKSATGQLEYKGSWKKTTLHRQHVQHEFAEPSKMTLNFDGFNSLFLYRRYYRCFTTLDSFSFEKGNVERKENLSLEDFHQEYDGQKPVLITELAEKWPARSTWTVEQLLVNYGDTAFRISQRSSKKITMKFKDYVLYMKIQHDEDPLYIFDDEFGEVAPGLLKDYSVPYLFREDLFDVLDRDQRPPFRWLIIGPERSGASWHVDPALTSAWNTLLCGRKRWALYPPGRVPVGVTVHVNEEDGDVNIETPTSLQWWLDIYPLLAEEDKPIECTQLPGETIFVPSGWWHCVLNLETTIAVTQNFVNSKDFEFVCLDMAPGYHHKGVCRAGLLAVDENTFTDAIGNAFHDEEWLTNPAIMREEKYKLKNDSEAGEDPLVDDNDEKNTNGFSKGYSNLQNQNFSYDIDFLSMFLEDVRDHYSSIWSPSNCMGEREMREWLHKLWVGKPGMRDLIWKGACLAMNTDKWASCMATICAFHNVPAPSDDEKFPVGTGSNPVFLVDGYVIKIYVEGGLESSIHGLGTELEFYSLLYKVNSSLKDHIPSVLASGILIYENGSYKTVPWDGNGVPDVITKCNLVPGKSAENGFPFGVWSKQQFEYREAGIPIHELVNPVASTKIWPYIITRRCEGYIFAHLRDALSWDDVLNLASFLGDQLRKLHLLPLPSLPDSLYSDNEKKMNLSSVNSILGVSQQSSVPVEWGLFIETLTRKKKDVSSRLAKWGDPIPSSLIDKVEKYLPEDFAMLINLSKDENGLPKSPTWIHMDIMDDNIHMEPCFLGSCLNENGPNANGAMDCSSGNGEQRKWRPSHILDFSDLSIGDPLFDLIPIHLDVFRGNSYLLQQFLESYRLAFVRRISQDGPMGSQNKFSRTSYRAMCYCILHDENILGAIFSLWKELRSANSWEEVEEAVWGDLNKYESFC